MPQTPVQSHLHHVEQLAHRLIAEHIPHWSFRFNRQRRTLGLCRFREQRIELSRHHAAAGSLDQAEATLLHEIAHALAGPRTGHGPKWQRVMHSLGQTPEVTARTSYDLDDYRWALVRRDGNHLHWIAGRYRKPRQCAHLVLRGRPETLGSVYFCAYEDYLAWQNGKLALEALDLRQE